MSVSCVSDSSDCVCPPAVDLCHLVLYTWCSYCRKASPTHSQWSRLCWSATTSDIIWNNFLFHPSHFYHIALYICFMKWSLSCLVLSILCDPVDCSLPGSPAHGILQAGKNTGVGSHSVLQGIFPTQGLNLGLLLCSRLFASELPGKPYLLHNTD